MVLLLLLLQMLLMAKLLVFRIDLSLDRLERVADEHRSVEGLVRRLPESSQLEHGQVHHLQATLLVALFVIARHVASVTAPLQMPPRTGELMIHGTAVVGTAQFKVRLAILRAPDCLLRGRRCFVRW